MRLWLMLLLSMTMLSCTTAKRVAGGLIETTDYNRGTLVGVPSMSLREIREKSTFDLGKGADPNYSSSKSILLIRSYRFDWQLPNSTVKFKDCAGYTILTDRETGERVVTMDVFTGRKYFTWTEVKAEAYQVEQMLINDGWRPELNRANISSSERFHKMLENPDFNGINNDIAAVAYGKGNLAMSFYVKLDRNKGRADVAAGDNFIHYVTIDNGQMNLVP